MSAGAPACRTCRSIKDVPTNSTMLELDVLPEHLLIIGGSYIRLEFAQMYRRFGSGIDGDREWASG
jgi:pyruvate/2-oxoglutarate dehydrogenase complex dihydrolipoamide dehydrogenase (E3) component